MKPVILAFAMIFVILHTKIIAQRNEINTFSNDSLLNPENLPAWLLQSSIGKLKVHHYPDKVFATKKIVKNDTFYIWKHTTNLMNAFEKRIIIREAGAYILQKDKWKLRIKYTVKKFAGLFNCPEGVLEPGQPYVFINNWRKSPALFQGYALWYFKGIDDRGKIHVGYAIVETKDELLTNKSDIEK